MRTTRLLSNFIATVSAITVLLFSWAPLVRALGFHYYHSYKLIGNGVAHAWYNRDLSILGFIGVAVLIALVATMMMTAGNKRIY